MTLLGLNLSLIMVWTQVERPRWRLAVLHVRVAAVLDLEVETQTQHGLSGWGSRDTCEPIRSCSASRWPCDVSVILDS